MDDLPKKPQEPVSPVGSTSKETGPHITFNEAPELTEIGKETPLPPEVSKAGVTLRSDSVTVPKPVQYLGVKAVGQVAVSQGSGAVAVSLPLTDDQIAQGLHQSITSSWRWLSEWCMLQLKKAHVAFKTMHGKIMRKEG